MTSRNFRLPISKTAHKLEDKDLNSKKDVSLKVEEQKKAADSKKA